MRAAVAADEPPQAGGRPNDQLSGCHPGVVPRYLHQPERRVGPLEEGERERQPNAGDDGAVHREHATAVFGWGVRDDRDDEQRERDDRARLHRHAERRRDRGEQLTSREQERHRARNEERDEDVVMAAADDVIHDDRVAPDHRDREGGALRPDLLNEPSDDRDRAEARQRGEELEAGDDLARILDDPRHQGRHPGEEGAVDRRRLSPSGPGQMPQPVQREIAGREHVRVPPIRAHDPPVVGIAVDVAREQQGEHQHDRVETDRQQHDRTHRDASRPRLANQQDEPRGRADDSEQPDDHQRGRAEVSEPDHARYPAKGVGSLHPDRQQRIEGRIRRRAHQGDEQHAADGSRHGTLRLRRQRERSMRRGLHAALESSRVRKIEGLDNDPRGPS